MLKKLVNLKQTSLIPEHNHYTYIKNIGILLKKKEKKNRPGKALFPYILINSNILLFQHF